MTIEKYKEEFARIISCETLGTYNYVEKITAFLVDKSNNLTYNYYTIFSFGNSLSPSFGNEYLTKKLISIDANISLGISKSNISIKNAIEYFDELCKQGNNETVDIGDGTLCKGVCELIPKTFVPQNSTKEVQINKIIKNNFYNGSYIFEFFNIEKKYLTGISSKSINKINDEIYKLIPIDLTSVSDRIGNFIFQIPSINTHVDYVTDRSEETLTYNVILDEYIDGITDVQLMSEVWYDGNIIGFGSGKIKSGNDTLEFNIGDTSTLIKTTVVDLKNNVVLSAQETSFILQMKFDMLIGNQYGEKRIIFDSQKRIVDTIEISSISKTTINEPVIRKYKRNIEQRQYEKRIEELKFRQEFKQYDKTSNHDEAIKDIRKIMNKAKKGKVYLWDPYLTADDILDTWYYNKIYELPLYAITSSEAFRGQSVAEWIQNQEKVFESRSNNYGIKMEIRCQHGEKGYHFHDRFIMILNESEKPRVWSLGTSVNSVGKRHHIIQEVNNPQNIVDAFDTLWEDIDCPECLVWKR